MGKQRQRHENSSGTESLEEEACVGLALSSGKEVCRHCASPLPGQGAIHCEGPQEPLAQHFFPVVTGSPTACGDLGA